MGNSAAIVMKDYFDIVEARAAKDYWSIRPIPRIDRKMVTMAFARHQWPCCRCDCCDWASAVDWVIRELVLA